MQVNDYYKILELKYKFSAFTLLSNYFKKVKAALTLNDFEEFTKIRMGYEVLRDDEIVKDYNRIYRKYVLNEELNFPQLREEQMIIAFREREQIGNQIAKEVIENKESFMMHRNKFIFELWLGDLAYILTGASGTIFICGGLIITFQFFYQTAMFTGFFIILLGVYFLRRNIIWKIIRST